MMSLLLPMTSVFPQSLMDYVSAVKGDTLVIKDYYEMNNQPNSLYYTLFLDTVDVPLGRVYELKANGYYSNEIQPRTSANHPTVIVGADPTPVVNNKNVNSSPPLICNEPAEVETPIGIEAWGDLTIKNCALVPAAKNGTVNWLFASISAPNLHLIIDNCIMERTLWVFVSTIGDNCDIIFRNCYFVNMGGHPGRHLGGVFDNFTNQDTLIVENCTHIMAQGNIYTFKQLLFSRIIINHNTFINCAGSVFKNSGYQGNISLTNNLFVNSNIHPYDSSSLGDIPDPDPDRLPIGLVNVNPYPLDGSITPRKFLVQSNLVYWDPMFYNCDSILNANRVNGHSYWKAQNIIMNSRTQSMFNDDLTYPYLITDTWKNKIPHFTDPKDLFTAQLTNLKSFVIESADDSSPVSLPTWRLLNTEFGSYVNPDWPVPVDLSYNDAALLNAGIGGFPPGDLNWFPSRKVDWLIQRSAEYDSIHSALNSGRIVTTVDDHDAWPVEFQLWQNYPNPFNSNTIISFSIPKAGYITLKVFDIMGQEVATLLDGFRTSQTYNVEFDGTGLAGGIYFYRFTAYGENQIRKMVFLK